MKDVLEKEIQISDLYPPRNVVRTEFYQAMIYYIHILYTIHIGYTTWTISYGINVMFHMIQFVKVLKRFVYDKSSGKMVLKYSVGESIRLGDELVSIDGVSVDGKLATDCEAAVKKSTHCFSFWNCIARSRDPLRSMAIKYG